jgi:hypothetical protein
MKRIEYIFLFLIAPGLSSTVNAQEVPSGNPAEPEKTLREIYLGIGTGAGTSGASLGIAGTVVLGNGFGFTISKKGHSYKAKNLPRDYSGLLRPHDNLASTSFRLLYESKLAPRFGIEIGPAWIKYQELQFTPRPESNCTGWFCFKPMRNYDYEPVSNELAGLTIRTKLDFGRAKHVGGEFAIIANINGYRPLFGLELYLTLGKVNDNPRPKSRSYN